jgi:hypothetical protein
MHIDGALATPLCEIFIVTSLSSDATTIDPLQLDVPVLALLVNVKEFGDVVTIHHDG